MTFSFSSSLFALSRAGTGFCGGGWTHLPVPGRCNAVYTLRWCRRVITAMRDNPNLASRGRPMVLFAARALLLLSPFSSVLLRSPFSLCSLPWLPSMYISVCVSLLVFSASGCASVCIYVIQERRFFFFAMAAVVSLSFLPVWSSLWPILRKIDQQKLCGMTIFVGLLIPCRNRTHASFFLFLPLLSLLGYSPARLLHRHVVEC